MRVRFRTTSSPHPTCESGDYRTDQFPVNVGQAKVTALKFEGQEFMVHSETVQNRGLQIVNVHGIFHDVVTVVVRFAESKAALDAASGKPHGEAARMMVATVVVLGKFPLTVDGSSEL